jgi:uncharacterized protein with HEPN domain
LNRDKTYLEDMLQAIDKIKTLCNDIDFEVLGDLKTDIQSLINTLN